jgi:hypothetical protein
MKSTEILNENLHDLYGFRQDHIASATKFLFTIVDKSKSILLSEIYSLLLKLVLLN